MKIFVCELVNFDLLLSVGVLIKVSLTCVKLHSSFEVGIFTLCNMIRNMKYGLVA